MKKKACVYVRVSTDHIEQDQSYQAQMTYFKDHYKDYEIVETYAERESGTSIKNRTEFQKMLKDAGLELELKRGNINIYNTNKEPKFNYIITKSISRYARNTEIKTVIRKLKAQGVYIIFDDINKSTESEDDELLLGILLQMSEEESRNKSKIIKWGKKRSAEQNVIPMNIIPYGYKGNIGENKLEIDEHEAKVVKYIFELYLNGNGGRKIREILTEEGYKNRKGKEFTENMILYIIQNPKYCAINVRNRYMKDDIFNQTSQVELSEDQWLKMKNERIDKIISEEDFEKAQEIIESRRRNGRGYRGYTKSQYANKIQCECGGNYIHNMYYNKDGSKKGIFVCNRRKKMGKTKSGCTSRNIFESELEEVIDEYCNGKYKEILFHEIDVANKYLDKKLAEVKKTDITNIKNKANHIENILEENKRKIEKLIDMLLDSSNTKEDIVNKKINLLEEENKRLEEDKNELNIVIKNKDDILNNINNFKKLLKEIEDKTKNLMTLDKNEFTEDILLIQLDENNNIEIYDKIIIKVNTLRVSAKKWNINQNLSDNYNGIIRDFKENYNKK
ncbi:recombinase family protein [Clostridium sp.]|uniref:recombinase family protein n=1 Tax=Clostridium sp. TaxID=1506 RepID=UPI003217783D